MQKKTAMLNPGTESMPRFLVGSYAPAGRGGIHLCGLGPGGPVLLKSFSGIDCPSYLALGGDGENLYAVSETETNAFVYACRLGPAGLKVLNRMPVSGAPCHLAVKKDKSLLAVACYLGGEAVLFRLGKEGELLAGGALALRHKGHGPNPTRQEGPHVHCVTLVAGEKQLAVADLGTDELVLYPLPTAGEGQCTPEPVRTLHLPPGSGPRHIARGKNGLLYVLCELSSEIATLDGKTGALLARMPTLPEEQRRQSEAAAIRLSPSGGLLYATNRGYDSVSCFSTGGARGGGLKRRAILPTGKTPRDCNLLAGHLLVACQGENLVQAFPLRQGLPRSPAKNLFLEAPSCIIPLPRP